MTNSTEVKVTVAEKFDMVIEALTNAEVTEINGIDLIEFLTDRKDKATRKSGTKAEKPENADIRTAILEYLGTVDKARISDVTKGVNDILDTEYTSNKVSAQMTKLKNDGTVVREVEKKIAYFSLATEQPKKSQRGLTNKPPSDIIIM